MFPAHRGEEVSGGASASGSYVFLTSADALNGFLEVLALPFQISRHSLIEGCRRVLTMSLGVFFQLRLALRLEGDHVHNRPDCIFLFRSLRCEKPHVK